MADNNETVTLDNGRVLTGAEAVMWNDLPRMVGTSKALIGEKISTIVNPETKLVDFDAIERLIFSGMDGVFRHNGRLRACKRVKNGLESGMTVAAILVKFKREVMNNALEGVGMTSVTDMLAHRMNNAGLAEMVEHMEMLVD